MNTPLEIWNERYGNTPTAREAWLERVRSFFPANRRRALDLGCGAGFDSEVLLDWGYEVDAVDFSPAAIEHARRRNPRARHFVMDLAQLPAVPVRRYDVVIANLSLHYFERDVTERIVKNVFALLDVGGVFVMRVNAIDDVAFGAPAGEERASWQTLAVDGVPKQFFDDAKIETLLRAQAEILGCEKLISTRFGRPKSLYEVVAQKREPVGTEPKRRQVGAVVFDGFELLDLYGPLQMFGMLHGHFSIELLAENPGNVRSSQGPRAVASTALANTRGIDLLLIPGGAGTRWQACNPGFLSALREQAERAETVLTVCTGSGLLARTGLLDGRRATSNKRAFGWAREQGANVSWVPQARWVEDGKYFTASGVSAGIDGALAVIERLCGPELARDVALWAEYDRHVDASWDPFAAAAGLEQR